MVTEPVFIIGDFGKDLDDEHTLVLAASLVRKGLITLTGVVGNLRPSELRARIAKGTLNQLGLNDVPVAIGENITENINLADYEEALPYLADRSEVHESGEDLLHRVLTTSPEPITLILQSGMTDAAIFIAKYPELAKAKIRHVQIMGGLDLTKSNLAPNEASNNSFDSESAERLYDLLVQHDIPSTTLTREAAYAVKVPLQLYDELINTGHVIGENLQKRQLPSLQHWWGCACAEPGSKIREHLPANRDRKWFVERYCNGNDPGIANGGDVMPYVKHFYLYDPINLIAAIPTLREKYFSPKEIKSGKTKHRIIGLSSEDNGVADAAGLGDFLFKNEVEALQASTKQKPTKSLKSMLGGLLKFTFS